MTLNATQKNLLFAAGTAAVAAAGPVGPVAMLGLVAQPIVAATAFTKNRGILAKVGQAALGAGLSFVGIGVGAIINPTIEKGAPQVAEAPAPVEQVVEVAEEPTRPAIVAANETPWAAPAVDPATVADAAPGNVDPGKPRVAPTTAPAVVPATSSRMSLREAQWEMCDAGKQYRNDVRQGYMNTRQAIREAAEYAVYIQQENGLQSYGNSPLSSAASHGFDGGSCNIYR